MKYDYKIFESHINSFFWKERKVKNAHHIHIILKREAINSFG